MGKTSNMMVPSSWSGQERRFGESLKENLDVICGLRGDDLDKAVTFRDLLDSGIAKLAAGSGVFNGSSGGITPDPWLPDIGIPPAPTNLTANGAFQSILLNWDMQQYYGHSAVEIYRHTSDSIADATLVASVYGFTSLYSDNVGGDKSYWYWVRGVNQNGVYGPYNSSTGTNGTTAPDVGLLLATLAGSITSSQLATSLSTPIATIPSLSGTINSLEMYTGYASSYTGDNLVTRISGIDTGVSTLQSSVSSLNTSVSNLQSSVSDLTTGVSSVYVQTSEPTGTISTNSRWYDSDDNMAPYYYDGSNWVSIEDPRIASNQNSITSLNAQVFNGDSTARLATASALGVLDSTVVAQGNSITSISADVTALNNSVYDSSGNLELATSSALGTLSSTVTSQGNTITSVQSDITDLEGQVFNADGTARLATGSALSGVSSSVTAIYDGTNASVVKTVQTDVTSLEGEVFNANGTARLATGTALAGVSSDISAIYDGTNPSVVKTVQTDITSLEGEVFNVDGTARLATGSALAGVSTSVTAIYDGANPSVVKTVQADVTSLEGEVFNTDGTARLATGTALAGVSSDVSAIYNGTNPSVVKSVQSDVSDLEGEVFNANGTARLATGSALSSLTNDVEAIYDGDNASVVKSVQTSITSLNNAVFDESGNTVLASNNAVSSLEAEVWGGGVTPSGATTSRIDSLSSTVNDPDTGMTATSDAVSVLNTEVYGSDPPTAAASRIDSLVSQVFNADGSVALASAGALEVLETEVWGSSNASASRIDGLFTEVFNSDGSSRLASAEAFVELKTEVTEGGSLATRIDSIAAEMFVDGDTDGELNLATAGQLETIENEVFPDGTAKASRLDQVSSAIWSGGDPDNATILASADFVSEINTAVFGTPTGQSAAANKIDTLQVIVEGEDGAGGVKAAIETTQEIVSGEDGLESQYSVKIDSGSGAVSGFGLSSTPSDDGSPTSAFIVRADRFAIINPSSTNVSTTEPSNSAELTVPFVVQSSSTTIDGIDIPAGVYMDGAFIKNGTITTAQIGNATIDTANVTGKLSASRLEAGTIDASQISIVGAPATLNIASAASGARMVIEADSIKVYDAVRLRVVLGNLG